MVTKTVIESWKKQLSTPCVRRITGTLVDTAVTSVFLSKHAIYERRPQSRSANIHSHFTLCDLSWIMFKLLYYYFINLLANPSASGLLDVPGEGVCRSFHCQDISPDNKKQK